MVALFFYQFTIMYTVYILYSASTQKYYTGQTQNIENRMLEHNSGETTSIKNGIPWVIVWRKDVETRAEAMQLEQKIKYRGARRFIEDIGSSAK
jgi:putative endonuclease